MRRIVAMALMAAGIGMMSPAVPAQVLKNEPKPDPKEKKDAPKEPEWPKEILGKSLSAWVKEIEKSKDASARDEAIRILPGFGPDARKIAGPALLNALTKDPDLNVRLTVLAVVPQVGFDDANMEAGLNAIVSLIKPGTHANHTKHEAAMCLANCGPLAKRAIPALLEYTCRDTTSWQLRKAGVYALGRVAQPMPAPPAKDKKEGKEPSKKRINPADDGPDVLAVRGLARMLNPDVEHSHQVRREVINSLVLLGPPHEEAAWKELRKALTLAFKDPDHSIVIWARVAYIRSEQTLAKAGDANLKALLNELHSASADSTRRLEILQAIGVLGDEARSAIDEIIALATSIDPEKKPADIKPEDMAMAGTAIWILAAMPSEMPKSMPVLDKLKSHKNEAIKQAAEGAYKLLVLSSKDPGREKVKEQKDK